MLHGGNADEAGTVRAAPHGPSLLADNVGCHFYVLLSTDNDGPCGASANTQSTLSADVIRRYFDIIFCQPTSHAILHTENDQHDDQHCWLTVHFSVL